MSLIMWATFDQYYQVDSEPRVILYLLEHFDWVVTLALYDPDLINYEYTPVPELRIFYEESTC